MYDSFSLHESSFVEPRAIVFGPKAEFILSFNGGLHQRAGNSLEVMQYQSKTGVFEFREIAFNTPLKEPGPEMLTEADIEFHNADFKYTKANPNKCVICHTQPTHPIWETYFVWPGAYGSNDDALTTLFDKEETNRNPNYRGFKSGAKPGVSTGRFVQLKPGVVDKEFLGFQKFIKGKPTHPRYKYLPNRAIDTAFVRLNAGEKMDSIDTTAAIQSEAKELRLPPGANYLYRRPNLDFNTKLYALTMDSFITKSLANPATRTLPFKITWAVRCATVTDMKNGGFEPSLYGIESVDPLKFLAPILSNAEAAQIQKTSGPWKEFYRKYIEAELDMEVAKLQRLERTFGDDSLEVSDSYSKNQFGFDFTRVRDSKYYEVLKGRPLSRLEKIASLDEVDNLFAEALNAYVAKGFGVEMQNFSTTLYRTPTLREGGYDQMISALFAKGLLTNAKSYVGFQNLDSEICEQVARKARGQ
jgi:hypothetical protein